MIFNSFPFVPQPSETYKQSGHFQKLLDRWNTACKMILYHTRNWQLHWSGKEKMPNEEVSFIENELKLLFVERDKCEVKIREEQPA